MEFISVRDVPPDIASTRIGTNGGTFMRVATLVFALLAIAATAYAADPTHFSSPDPLNLPEVRDAIYCQQTSASWNAFNASSGFASELADGVPGTYAGSVVTSVTLYVAEWGGSWMNPPNMIVNFYNQQCPPEQAVAANYTVPWGSCTSQMIYNGGWTVYSVSIPINPPYTLGATSSIGGIVGNNWGQNGPYCGLVICDVVTGCEIYWDGTYWGAPRWTPGSYYFGFQADLAYCLEGGQVPAQDTSWGQVKSLFR